MEEEKIEKNEEKEGLLVGLEKYLQSGIHIGTKIKTGDMKEFIYKRRKDKIYIMNIDKINERIQLALNTITSYPPEEIVVVATRTYAENAARKMVEMVGGIELITKRFIPGTFTNPKLPYFKEPSLVIVCDPRGEKEAIREANMMNIPVVALLDTENSANGVDLIVPMNNKGRKSLALFFWILTREFLLKQGKIEGYDKFKTPINAFEKLELEE